LTGSEIIIEILIANPHKKQYIEVEKASIYWSIFHGGLYAYNIEYLGWDSK